MKRRSLSNQLRYACSKQLKLGISRRSQKKQGVNTKENIYSIQSMKKMKTMARQLGDFVRTNHPDIHYIYEIKPGVVRNFVQEKGGDWISKATKVEKLSQLRKLESVCKAAFPGSQINFMEGIDNGIFERDGKAPVRDIYMTQHDYKALEDKCLSSRSQARYIPLITRKIGSRLQEAASLKPCDIDLKHRVVHLTNCKGGKNRDVPIQEEDITFFAELKKMCLDQGWPTVCGGLTPGSVSKFISRSLATLYQKGEISLDYNAHKTGNHAIRKLYARSLLAKLLNVSEQELSSISKKELLQAWPKVQTILGHGPVGRVQLFRVYIGNYV